MKARLILVGLIGFVLGLVVAFAAMTYGVKKPEPAPPALPAIGNEDSVYVPEEYPGVEIPYGKKDGGKK